jgi:TonB family protein
LLVIRIILLLIVLLAGCTTSRFHGDPIKETDALFSAYEAEGMDGSTPELSAAVLQVYADRPEYTELIGRDHASGTRFPRPRTMVPPRYPRELLLARVKASVTVAFLVDEDGVVLDAREVQSDDDRFTHPALEAVRKWSFYPGTINGTPSRFILVAPIAFRPEA